MNISENLPQVTIYLGIIYILVGVGHSLFTHSMTSLAYTAIGIILILAGSYAIHNNE